MSQTGTFGTYSKKWMVGRCLGRKQPLHWDIHHFFFAKRANSDFIMSVWDYAENVEKGTR